MKKILIPILLGLSLVAVSCQGLLEIPQKGVVSTETFYASDADAEAALADMYASFLSVASANGINNPELMMLNYSSDDILAAGGHIDDHEPFRFFCEFRYDNTNDVMQTCYDRYVAAIYHCNLVISNFTTENRNETAPKFESAFTKQAVAEARVIRAYVHMMMAIIWNRPAIIDRLLEPDELPVQAESQSQILKWVVSECDKAIKSGALPVRASTKDKNATARASVGFAQFVAGKAAIFDGDFATAKSYLTDLINSGKYALIDGEEYWTNFHKPGDGNAEKIFEPNYIYDSNLSFWDNVNRSRWMVADVLCWRTDALGSVPPCTPAAGWNGGAIQEDFAKKFLAHDGDSPRRKACFLTEKEWLIDMEWNSKVNDGTDAEKLADPDRGIKNTAGVYSHGPYFEWKRMSYAKPSRILTGGKTYPGDNINAVMGGASNEANFNVARFAEALLLCAEACLETGDAATGKKYLNMIQKRAGVEETELTFQNLMDEKQYEMWWEGCRFPDLVRWDNAGKVDMKALFNTSWGGKGIHKQVPTVFDEYVMEGKPGFGKEHKLYTTYSAVKYNDFEDKYKYFPFPRNRKNNNKFQDVLGWAYLNTEAPAAE